MPAMSHYLEDALVNCVFNDTDFSPPATYVALLTVNAVDSDTGSSISDGSGTGVEVGTGGTGYSRLLVSNWAAPVNGATSNSGLLVFPSAVTDWGVVTGVAICDAETNGNVLFHGALAAPKPVFVGDVLEFEAGAFAVSIG